MKAFLLAGLLFTLQAPAAPPPAPPAAPPVLVRVYHKTTIARLPRTVDTHVELEGRVTLVRREGDGDVHIRVEDVDHRFVVVEVIPEISLTIPAVGDRVVVRGIVRYDKRHRWHEIHPAEAIEIRPPKETR